MSTDLTFVTNEPGNNLRDRADFPACPPLKFGSTILDRTPSIGRTRPHLLPKKRCECGSNKRVCGLNVMFLLAAKCETAYDHHHCSRARLLTDLTGPGPSEATITADSTSLAVTSASLAAKLEC